MIQLPEIWSADEEGGNTGRYYQAVSPSCLYLYGLDWEVSTSRLYQAVRFALKDVLNVCKYPTSVEITGLYVEYGLDIGHRNAYAPTGKALVRIDDGHPDVLLELCKNLDGLVFQVSDRLDG